MQHLQDFGHDKGTEITLSNHMSSCLLCHNPQHAAQPPTAPPPNVAQFEVAYNAKIQKSFRHPLEVSTSA